jgi:hypothetical protein
VADVAAQPPAAAKKRGRPKNPMARAPTEDAGIKEAAARMLEFQKIDEEALAELKRKAAEEEQLRKATADPYDEDNPKRFNYHKCAMQGCAHAACLKNEGEGEGLVGAPALHFEQPGMPSQQNGLANAHMPRCSPAAVAARQQCATA